MRWKTQAFTIITQPVTESTGSGSRRASSQAAPCRGSTARPRKASKRLPVAQTRAELNQVLRATGFAAAPGMIRILGIIPLLGILANFVANIWMLAAFVVAIRQVLSYTSTGRAVAVCIVGFIIYFLVLTALAVIGLGGLAALAV